MMNSVRYIMVWILVLTLLSNVCCQDGYNNLNVLRVQQVANEGQLEANTGFNNVHNDQNSQTSLNTRYQMSEDPNNFELNRERSRPKKVYRIKNPFQTQQEEVQDNSNSHDSDTSASNQYASMQYSLPPEEFLQKMRAENQYHQQQQQLSTQPSVYSYTATPQPQYSYSTMTATNYDNQPNQNVQDPKSVNYFNPNVNSFQYSNANTYALDSPVSTLAPTYLSTSSNQYMGTPANTYVSSASPMFITNPPNLQQSYVSSPYSNTQTGTIDYNTNKVTTIGNNPNNYDNNNNIYNKKVQIDHYSNAGNALRYQANVQNYPSSTMSPISSPYSEEMRDNWGHASTNYNNGVVHKSAQDVLVAQYSTNPYYRVSNNQNTYQHEANYDNVNQDIQRYNTISGANNNMYYNYFQPNNQVNNLKNHVKETDQQNGQTVTYSHGDYGWKLDRKPMFGSEISTAGYSVYQHNNAKSDNEAVSQVSFHMDTSRPYNYNQISKSNSEKLEAEDFARAVAKAHDNYKQQLELNRISSTQFNNNAFINSDSVNSYYANDDKNKNSLLNGNIQASQDYVTASPYTRESHSEIKPKQTFDHDKAIKNIVPIDVTNVVPNSNTQYKSNIGIEYNDKYSYNKDQSEQNLKQYNRPTSETYYKDKNNIYTFSINSQPEEYLSLSERLKQLDLSPQQGKSSDTLLGYNSFTNQKRYVDESQSSNYANQNPSNQENIQSSGNVQQNSLQRNPISSDLAALLKLNDIPLRVTQNLNSESLRLPTNNYDIPNSLPVRLNQNIEQHHVDVASEIISKLLSNRQNINKQDLQSNNQLSTIHGFKVANPFNIDLKLVSDMLRGKSTIDESQLGSVRDQYSKPMPIKFDLPQIQQLLFKNENGNSLDSLGILPSSYFDMYNNGRYQGVKYSRSEEEPENIPIAESSNSHLIGAVVEEIGQHTTDIKSTDDEIESNNDDDRGSKHYNTHHRIVGDRFRHTNNLGRHMYHRQFPKSMIEQPHPVLKPPPSHKFQNKLHPMDKINRKRRISKPKHLRLFKTEALFEANTVLDDIKPAVSTLLKPPPVIEDRSDVVDQEESTIESTTYKTLF